MTSALTFKSEFIFVYSVYNVQFILGSLGEVLHKSFSFNVSTFQKKHLSSKKTLNRNFASTLTWSKGLVVLLLLV